MCGLARWELRGFLAPALRKELLRSRIWHGPGGLKGSVGRQQHPTEAALGARGPSQGDGAGGVCGRSAATSLRNLSLRLDR